MWGQRKRTHRTIQPNEPTQKQSGKQKSMGPLLTTRTTNPLTFTEIDENMYDNKAWSLKMCIGRRRFRCRHIDGANLPPKFEKEPNNFLLTAQFAQTGICRVRSCFSENNTCITRSIVDARPSFADQLKEEPYGPTNVLTANMSAN